MTVFSELMFRAEVLEPCRPDVRCRSCLLQFRVLRDIVLEQT